MRVVLASASPRRRELLRKAGISCRVRPSRIAEASYHKRPIPLVRELALRKAGAVAKHMRSGAVLGADTVVVLKGRILGKPRDARHAYRMLYALSGSTHAVYTGVALIDAATGRKWVAYEKSLVRMKKLPLETLLRLSRAHHDKAGAYAIQEKRDPIARVVKGSYDNVVGLPVGTVKSLLKKLSQAL